MNIFLLQSIIQFTMCKSKWKYVWVQVFKNEPSKICGRQPLKNFTSFILEYLDPFMARECCYYGFTLKLKTFTVTKNFVLYFTTPLGIILLSPTVRVVFIERKVLNKRRSPKLRFTRRNLIEINIFQNREGEFAHRKLKHLNLKRSSRSLLTLFWPLYY